MTKKALFSLYVIFSFVSYFLSYFLSLFLSSPCFPVLILVYCTFFPPSVITHERGNYAFCHFLVCWLASLALSLTHTHTHMLCQFCPGPECGPLRMSSTCSVLEATFFASTILEVASYYQSLLGAFYNTSGSVTDLCRRSVLKIHKYYSPCNFKVKCILSFFLTISKLIMILWWRVLELKNK